MAKTALVIDDNPIHCDVPTEELWERYECFECHSVSEARKMLANFQVDLLVANCSTGAACEELVEWFHRLHPQTPAIVITDPPLRLDWKGFASCGR